MPEQPTRKAFREHLNEMDRTSNTPRDHRHNAYHQRTRLYGDYLWFQDRAKFESDYAEWCVEGRADGE